MFRLRPARPEDAREVRELIRRAHINPIGLDWRRFLVAEGAAGEIIGTGQVRAHADGSRELASVAVVEQWRGQGVARALIERIQCQAGPPLWLTCREGLVPMYARFGFQRVWDGKRMSPYMRCLHGLARLVLGVGHRGEGLAIMVWQESCTSDRAPDVPS